MEKTLLGAPWEPFRRPLPALLAAAWLALGAPGCGAPAPDGPAEAGPDPRMGLSADAKLETEAMLREDLAAPRDPSDGGGRAWRVAGDDEHGGREMRWRGSRPGPNAQRSEPVHVN